MAKKPGYDVQPIFNLDKPLTDPSWVVIKSKKTGNAEFYGGNHKRIKRAKAKKASKVINFEDLEINEVLDATQVSEPEVNILIKHFEDRLEIMKRAYDQQSDTSGNDKILGCAISPNIQAQLKLVIILKSLGKNIRRDGKQSSESSSSDKISTKFSKLSGTAKEVRFSDNVGVAEFSPQNYFKSQIFYATVKRS